jgi:hypothetical protein
MTVRRIVVAIGLFFLLTAPSGGAAAGGAPAAIDRDLVDVPGADEPHTPPALNRALAFRYRSEGAPQPTIALVLIPGLNSGPNTFDIFARALIAGFGPGLEVWAVAPRSTLLQDRRGIDAALAYQNPDFALGYYYGSLQIDGHAFHRVRGIDVPFVAYWGLDVHLRDVRAIVREIQARYPGVAIVLGGHSLGGIFAAAYAGYDFASVPGADPAASGAVPDVGARDLAGLFFLDGMPVRIPIHLSPEQYLRGFRVPIIGRIPGVDNLTTSDARRRAGPFTQNSNFARTSDSILLDVVSVYAYLRPSEASYFPFYPRRGLAITNEALVAGIFSDQMQPDLFIRAAVEVPVGVFKKVPDPANVNPWGLLDLQSGVPVPGARLIHLTSGGSGPSVRVHLRALLTAILRPGGDFTEWYFPWRVILDLGLAARWDAGDQFARRYIGLRHVAETDLPMLIIGAGFGLIRSVRQTEFYRSRVATPPDRVDVHIIPGFSHLDVENAADPNPVVPLTLAWLKTLLSH